MAKNGEKRARVSAAIERRDAAIEALKRAQKALDETVVRIGKARDQAREYTRSANEDKGKLKGLRAQIRTERGKVREARKGVAAARKG